MPEPTPAVTPPNPEPSVMSPITPPAATPPTHGADGKILGKFANQEALVKAYQELEQKLGAAKPAETPDAKPKPTDTMKLPDAPPTPDAAKTALEGKGMDLGKFSKEFMEKGTLSDESYVELEKGGFSRQVVDAFVQGQTAIVQKTISDLHGVCGTKENFDAMRQWAATLPVPERAAYETAVASGDPEAIVANAKALFARFAREGKPPSLIGGRTSGVTGNGFRSTAEVVAAMKDPRYNSDPAYRAEVAERIKSSNLL